MFLECKLGKVPGDHVPTGFADPALLLVLGSSGSRIQILDFTECQEHFPSTWEVVKAPSLDEICSTLLSGGFVEALCFHPKRARSKSQSTGSGPSLNQEQRSSWLPGTGQSTFAETFPSGHSLLKDLGVQILRP